MYKRILVPVDGSPTASAGLREAIRLARDAGTTIRLLHVVDRLTLLQGLESPLILRNMLANMERTGRAALQTARARVEREGIAVQVTLVKPAKRSVAGAIVAEARRWKADLVAMGTHGWRANDSILMGSTAQGVIRDGTFPVLLVTEGARKSGYKRVLVPIDGSPASQAGLREAIRMAAGSRGSTIRLIHVMEPLPVLQGMETVITDTVLRNLTAFGEKILKQARSRVERHRIRAETVFSTRRQRPAADGIAREADKWGADVIVMGTHGRRGISRVVLGSDAEAVVRAAAIPVVLVRTAGDR